MPTPEEVRQHMAELLQTAEENRRERTAIHSEPVVGEIDYSHSGQVMELAMAHMRESVPSGQKLRTEAAFTALRVAIKLQADWLWAKGYDV